MTPEEFGALFDHFTSTAYRLELLPSYAVPDEDADYRAFLDHAPREERSVRTSAWMRRLAVSTVEGKEWSRTRVVDVPLTEYQRFEIPSYLESQAVGEQISLVTRAEVTDILSQVVTDFWLFDAGTDDAVAAYLHYTPDGRVEDRELVTDPGTLLLLDDIRLLMQERATPLNEFVVGDLCA